MSVRKEISILSRKIDYCISELRRLKNRTGGGGTGGNINLEEIKEWIEKMQKAGFSGEDLNTYTKYLGNMTNLEKTSNKLNELIAGLQPKLKEQVTPLFSYVMPDYKSVSLSSESEYIDVGYVIYYVTQGTNKVGSVDVVVTQENDNVKAEILGKSYIICKIDGLTNLDLRKMQIPLIIFLRASSKFQMFVGCIGIDFDKTELNPSYEEINLLDGDAVSGPWEMVDVTVYGQENEYFKYQIAKISSRYIIDRLTRINASSSIGETKMGLAALQTLQLLEGAIEIQTSYTGKGLTIGERVSNYVPFFISGNLPLNSHVYGFHHYYSTNPKFVDKTEKASPTVAKRGDNGKVYIALNHGSPGLHIQSTTIKTDEGLYIYPNGDWLAGAYNINLLVSSADNADVTLKGYLRFRYTYDEEDVFLNEISLKEQEFKYEDGVETSCCPGITYYDSGTSLRFSGMSLYSSQYARPHKLETEVTLTTSFSGRLEAQIYIPIDNAADLSNLVGNLEMDLTVGETKKTYTFNLLAANVKPNGESGINLQSTWTEITKPESLEWVWGNKSLIGEGNTEVFKDQSLQVSGGVRAQSPVGQGMSDIDAASLTVQNIQNSSDFKYHQCVLLQTKDVELVNQLYVHTIGPNGTEVDSFGTLDFTPGVLSPGYYYPFADVTKLWDISNPKSTYMYPTGGGGNHFVGLDCGIRMNSTDFEYCITTPTYFESQLTTVVSKIVRVLVSSTNGIWLYWPEFTTKEYPVTLSEDGNPIMSTAAGNVRYVNLEVLLRPSSTLPKATYNGSAMFETPTENETFQSSVPVVYGDLKSSLPAESYVISNPVVSGLSFYILQRPPGIYSSVSIDGYEKLFVMLQTAFEAIEQNSIRVFDLSKVQKLIIDRLNVLQNYILQLYQRESHLEDEINQLAEGHKSPLGVLSGILLELGTVLDVVAPQIGLIVTGAGMITGAIDDFQRGDVVGGVIQLIMCGIALKINPFSKFSFAEAGPAQEEYQDYMKRVNSIPNEYIEEADVALGRVGSSVVGDIHDENIYEQVIVNEEVPDVHWQHFADSVISTSNIHVANQKRWILDDGVTDLDEIKLNVEMEDLCLISGLNSQGKRGSALVQAIRDVTTRLGDLSDYVVKEADLSVIQNLFGEWTEADCISDIKKCTDRINFILKIQKGNLKTNIPILTKLLRVVGSEPKEKIRDADPSYHLVKYNPYTFKKMIKLSNGSLNSNYHRNMAGVLDYYVYDYAQL